MDLARFFGRTKAPPPVVVVAGDSPVARLLAIEAVAAQTGWTGSLERYAAPELSLDELLRVVLGQASVERRLVVYEGLEAARDRSALYRYCRAPTPGVTAVLVASAARDPQGAQWVPEAAKLALTVEAPALSAEALARYGESQGLWAEDAAAVVTALAADEATVVAHVRVCAALRTWTATGWGAVPQGLPQRLLPDPALGAAFWAALAVSPDRSAEQLCRQLAARCLQVARLAGMVRPREYLSWEAIAAATGQGPYVGRHLVALARQAPDPAYWLERYLRLAALEPYLRPEPVGARAALRAALC